ncbi:uncharacterized protein [Musca autumnalis]|uniref:uncharacterized protein n=1 Tax=Musca autumnalis TaxID=221902 RepID=UPI003CF7F856
MKSTNCVNLGSILMGENFELLILCNVCENDIGSDVKDFQQHLDSCINYSGFKKGKHRMKYNKHKAVPTRRTKDMKEFFIYDYSEVEILKSGTEFIDLLDIEEELLNPKWYTTENSVNSKSNKTTQKQYDVLVEEVTQFVQFKEPPNRNEAKKQFLRTEGEVNCAKPKTKRRISVGNNEPVHEMGSKLNITDCSPTSAPTKRSKIVEAPSIPSIVKPRLMPNTIANNIYSKQENISRTTDNKLIAPTKEKETAQILNKLSSLGLQIKRTHPQAKTPAPPADGVVTDEKTLQILKKLQSKGGMKVKLINKQSQNGNTGGLSVPATNTNSFRLANESTKLHNLIIRKVK